MQTYLIVLTVLLFPKFSGGKFNVPHILDIFDWDSVPSNLQLVVCTNDPNFDFYLKNHHFSQTISVVKNNIFQPEGNEAMSNSLINFGELSSVILFLPRNFKEFLELFLALQHLIQDEVKTRGSPIIILWPEDYHDGDPVFGDKTKFLTNLQNYMVTKDGVDDEEYNNNVSTTTTLKLTIDLDLYLLFLNSTNFSTDEENKNAKFKLFELYSIKQTDYLEEICFKNKLIRFDTLTEKLRRRNQFNKTVITAVAQNDPVLAQDEVLFNSEKELEAGLAVKLFWDLRDMLNFTARAQEGSSLSLKNNRVSGLSYEMLVENKTADLSISHATILEIRAKVFSFLQPTSVATGVNVFFKQPPLNKMRNIFVAPFHYNLWLTMICTWTAVVLCMSCLSWVSSVQGQTYDNVCDNDSSFISDSYMWAIAAMCQKGWPTCPKRQSMRIVFFCGCLSGLIVYVAYSASIVSVLSVKHVPIKQFSDLIPYNFMFYVHEKSSTLRILLQEDVINKYNLSQGILVTDTANEVNIILTSTNAFLSFPDVFYSAAISLGKKDRFICETISSFSVNLYQGGGPAMYVRRGSPFTETFNHKILMVKERGLNNRYTRQYRSKTEANCASTVVKTLQLTNSDLFIAFIIILTGLVTAFLFLVTEKIVSKYRGLPSRFSTSSFFYRHSSNPSTQS